MPTKNLAAYSLAFRAGQDLRPDEALAAVLESADYGVFVTDLNHKSLLCNAKFGELFGIDIQKVVADDMHAVRAMVRDRIGDIKGWQANLEEVYGNPDLTFEDELVLKNPFQVLRRYTAPVHDTNGRIAARLWTFLDVTGPSQRRQLNQITNAALSFFDADPIVVCQHILDLVSQHYQSIALLSVLEGKYLRFVAKSGLPEEYQAVQGNNWDESYCQFCLGSKRPVVIQDATRDAKTTGLLPASLGLTRYAGVPLNAPDGSLIGTLCIMDNRSDVPVQDHDLRFLNVLATRISAELERHAVIKGLESGLESSNRELAETGQKLIQSEKLALVGTLAASVAHDIRNILASMSLQISMAEQNPERAVSFIRDSLARFDVLAHRLLSYAKPTQGMLELVDLTQVLNEVYELVKAQFSISSVELVCKAPTEHIFIQGDAGRLEHLFVNLAINALQALKSGARLTIELAQESHVAVVQFTDTGPGIPEAVKETLFEPFSTTRSDGFGLGLYSCRQIAEAHNGHISFTCPPSGGTIFTVQFPLQP